jgi:hypothetical protein
MVLREAINITEKLGGNADFLRAASTEDFIVFDGR